MKKFAYILSALAILLMGCNNDFHSDMQLNGDCLVEELALDNYSGAIDLASREVVVSLPEVYDERNMTLTTLTLSEGATASIKIGDTYNMLTPKMVRVTNWNVSLDWTVRVKHDEARIYTFKLNDTYSGIIDENNKTISVFVPSGISVTALIPMMRISDGASVTPPNGVACDFTTPVDFTVTNNTATATYTVTVTPIGAPHALFIGLAPTMEQLSLEEKTACEWMLANIPNSLYASFADLSTHTVDLSECKVMWWHFHKDGGVDGANAFETAAPAALAAQVVLRDYYQDGGSFLFTRYATNMPAYIGAVANDAVPNNCWGQNEADAETIGGPWSFFITGQTGHPLYQNLIQGTNPSEVYTCDTGYRITNSTAQWHIGADWGGYPTTEDWRNATGGIDLGWGGDGAIVVWEFPKNDAHGGIVCIGSGCYDWYTVAEDHTDDAYHDNVATMTLNALNYLTANE